MSEAVGRGGVLECQEQKTTHVIGRCLVSRVDTEKKGRV